MSFDTLLKRRTFRPRIQVCIHRGIFLQIFILHCLHGKLEVLFLQFKSFTLLQDQPGIGSDSV